MTDIFVSISFILLLGIWLTFFLFLRIKAFCLNFLTQLKILHIAPLFRRTFLIKKKMNWKIVFISAVDMNAFWCIQFLPVYFYVCVCGCDWVCVCVCICVVHVWVTQCKTDTGMFLSFFSLKTIKIMSILKIV